MGTSNNCKNNKQRNVMKWLHNPHFFLLVYHWKAKVNGVSENWGQKTRQIFDIFCQKSINCKLVIQHIPYTPIIQKCLTDFLYRKKQTFLEFLFDKCIYDVILTKEALIAKCNIKCLICYTSASCKFKVKHSKHMI